MRIRRWSTLIVLALSTTSCAGIRGSLRGLFTSATDRLAGEAHVSRDAWGVPHVHAATLPGTAFGIGYAQAEDDFSRLEAIYIRALGREANLAGESGLPADLARAAFEVQRLAREEYDGEPRERREIWDAFALGVNYFIDTHPELAPRLIHRFEPWFLFAYPRSLLLDQVVDGYRLGVAEPLDIERATTYWQPSGAWTGEEALPRDELALGWTVAPDRSADGRRLAVLELAGDLTSDLQPYEAVIVTPEDRFAGAWLFGTPVPLAGHDGRSGWSRSLDVLHGTAGRAFGLMPADTGGTYVFGARAVEARDETVEVALNTADGVQLRGFRFRRSELGPAVEQRGDTTFVVAIAGFAQGGLLQQLLALQQANSAEAFSGAAQLAIAPTGSVFYTDIDGVTLYVEAPALEPELRVRDAARAPGADSDESTSLIALATHEPSRGGDRPWFVAGPRSDSARADARSVVGSVWPRSAAIAAMVAEPDAWTFHGWARSAFDRRFFGARSEVLRLIDIWERVGALDPGRAAALDLPMESLRLFDGLADTLSTAATIYAAYAHSLRGAGSGLPDSARLRALERALDWLAEQRGTMSVRLGELFRLRPTHAPDSVAARSLALAAGPPAAGIVTAVSAPPFVPSGDPITGRVWVMAVALGEPTEARSVLAFGQTIDQDAAHGWDQARLYAAGLLKTLDVNERAARAPTLLERFPR